MTETDPQGLTSTTPNTIGTVLVVSQGTGISDDNDFGDMSVSSYAITKELVTLSPTRPNAVVRFDIQHHQHGGHLGCRSAAAGSV